MLVNNFSEVLSAFNISCPVEVQPFGNGHINDTYRVSTSDNEYIIQRLNTDIFTNPRAVMHNIALVTEFIKSRIDSKDSSLSYLNSIFGIPFFVDCDGNPWRASFFIDNSIAFEFADREEMLRKTGEAFGRFLGILSVFPASELTEVIPDFHNTPARIQQFKEAVMDDSASRVKAIQSEIDFILQREHFANILVNLMNANELPIRVTHNDTKIGNVLFDKDTKDVKCVVDLDTVMPGLIAYDFGDSIRSCAATAPEDERELKKVNFDLNNFRVYTEGFLLAAGRFMTKNEIIYLPLGAQIITFEQGVRFLTDYINGDKYYKIDYPEHNLVRARNQFKLLVDMEINTDKMNAVIAEIMKEMNL